MYGGHMKIRITIFVPLAIAAWLATLSIAAIAGSEFGAYSVRCQAVHADAGWWDENGLWTWRQSWNDDRSHSNSP